MVSNISTEDIQSYQKYFSSYKSPNICIVPNTAICYPPSPKRPKLEIPITDNSPQKSIDVSFLDDFDVDEIIKCLNDCEDNTQNTIQTDIKNNNILERDCSESSFEIDNDRDNLFTKSIDNKEKDNIEIKENTHKNISTNTSCIETEITSSNVNENAELHINKGDSEMSVLSPIEKQPNDETNNTISDTPNIITNNEIVCMENKIDNKNTQELVKEGSIKKCLLKTEPDLVSMNKTSKSFYCDKNSQDMIASTCCEEKYQYSDDSKVHDKYKTTLILEVESKNNKFETNKIMENKHIQESKCSLLKNFKNMDTLQTINNNKKKDEIQKGTENRKVVLPEIINKSKPDITDCSQKFKNLEDVMFQYLHKQYSVFSLVHSGKYSNIFKCKDTLGEHYAVKMLKKKGNGYRQESMMIRIREDIPKENLLSLDLIAGFSFNRNWCYLTDFYTNNLKNVLKESKKNLHIDTIQELAGQLIGAVTTLRNKNIVHSDINPSHILVDSTNSKLRICGFDEAYYIETANLFPYKGTKCYRPPEVILGYSAGFSLDVWSTALVLHEMATGIQLFGGCMNDHLLYKQMCILGDVPPEMLIRSRFGNKYIIGQCLLKGKCLRHNHNSMLAGKNKIACTIQGAYYTHWAAGKNHKQISKDMTKIRQFIRLLEQMLVMYPVRRLPIEFAYANPFIYKVHNP